jgi:hypothetical protein
VTKREECGGSCNFEVEIGERLRKIAGGDGDEGKGAVTVTG